MVLDHHQVANASLEKVKHRWTAHDRLMSFEKWVSPQNSGQMSDPSPQMAPRLGISEEIHSASRHNKHDTVKVHIARPEVVSLSYKILRPLVKIIE